MMVSLRGIHCLELVHCALEAMLHHVAKLKIRLADLVVRHTQNLFYILKGKAITFQTFKGLSAPDKSFDIFRINLKNSSAICDEIMNGTTKMG